MAVTNDVSGFGGNTSGLDAFDQLMNYKKKTAKKPTTPTTPGLQSPFSSISLDPGLKTAQAGTAPGAPPPTAPAPTPPDTVTQPAPPTPPADIPKSGPDENGLWDIGGGTNVPGFDVMKYAKRIDGGSGLAESMKDGDFKTSGNMLYYKQGGQLYQVMWDALKRDFPTATVEGLTTGFFQSAQASQSHAPETMAITEDTWNYWKSKLDALGYDTSNKAAWLGKTIATGYWTPVNITGPQNAAPGIYPSQDGSLYKYENGKWYKYEVEKDLSNIAGKLNDMQNIQQPNLRSYEDALNGLQNLLTQMPTAENLYTQAQEAAARRLGFASADEMYQTQGDMFDQMQAGIGDGVLSVTQQRQMNMESQRMRDDYKKIIDSLNASGRSVAALQQADRFASTIADQRLRSQIEYENMNFAQSQAEYAALSQRWDAMFKNGSMAAQEYLDAQTKYWTDYISGYATMIGAISEANQGMLQAQAQHAQIIYSGILAELGVDAQSLELSNQLYEEYLAPYYRKLEEMGVNAQADAASAEQGMSFAGMILGALGSVLGALAGGIPGAVAGAAAGSSAAK